MNEPKTPKPRTIILDGHTYTVVQSSMTKRKMGGIKTKREEAIAKADQVLFNRIFQSEEFKSEVKQIRQKFGLPLPSRGDLFEWRGENEPNFGIIGTTESGEPILGQRRRRSEEFNWELAALAKRIGIRKNFFAYLREFVMFDTTWMPVYFGMGYPTITRRMKEDSTFFEEMIITPDTDIDNPKVINYIKDWQIQQRDAPPEPKLSESNRKKLDWRPVWEWEKRHPSVTRKVIAKMLNRDAVSVRRELENIDEEMGTQGKPRGIPKRK